MNAMLENTELTQEQIDEMIEALEKMKVVFENIMAQIRDIVERFIEALLIIWENITRYYFMGRLLSIGAPYWVAHIMAMKCPIKLLPRGWIFRPLYLSET